MSLRMDRLDADLNVVGRVAGADGRGVTSNPDAVLGSSLKGTNRGEGEGVWGLGTSASHGTNNVGGAFGGHLGRGGWFRFSSDGQGPSVCFAPLGVVGCASREGKNDVVGRSGQGGSGSEEEVEADAGRQVRLLPT